MKFLFTCCRLFKLSLILITFFLLCASAQAAGPPLSLEAYWQRVEETQNLVDSLEDASPAEREANLAAAADQWTEITRVTLPDGRLMPVDHTFLVSHLRANPPDLARLKELLSTLRTTRQSWPAPQHSSADLKTLEPILARPEFQWQPDRPSLLGELWRRFWERLWEWISPWLPEEGVISLDESVFSWARYFFIGLGTLLLFLVLAFILRGLLGDFVAETRLPSELEAGDEPLTAEAAFKQAQQLSGGGDYRTAMRYLYLSSLLLLDERRLLRYDRAQTNREYLRSVAHLPRLQKRLRSVIDVFDRVWYGYQPLDKEAYDQYARQVTELRRQQK